MKSTQTSSSSERIDELYTASEMDAPVTLTVPGGQVCVFARGNPEKDGPNEDSMAVISYLQSMTVLAVADGLGGSREGHEASAIAVRCLRSAIAKAASEKSSPRFAVLNGLEAANREILERAIGSATTVIVAAIAQNFIRAFHVGDSGLLQVGQRGRIKQLTVAHSPVGFAQASGMLSEEEALHHEERHLVSNSIGIAEMSIEVGPALPLARRDTVLLASDGLFDNLRTDEIIERIRRGPLDKAAAKLESGISHRMANDNPNQPNKPDDLSFILYRRTS